jgi:hypothetical protein
MLSYTTITLFVNDYLLSTNKSRGFSRRITLMSKNKYDKYFMTGPQPHFPPIPGKERENMVFIDEGFGQEKPVFHSPFRKPE